jgi:cyclopropane fatty-acyl-phospholipid synthase-like methyltransferase
MRPLSEAAERNKAPILDVLRRAFAGAATVLEIGSGTGQHAVHFAAALPDLVWQPTEMPGRVDGMRSRIAAAGLPNLAAPRELDVRDRPWKGGTVDAVFSANTAHIMAWPEVERMLEGVGEVLAEGGVFCLYGPIRSGGDFDTESNRRFDALLKSEQPEMGLRDREALVETARVHGLVLVAEHPMPANNRLLEWRKTRATGPA